MEDHDALRFARRWAEARPALAGWLAAVIPDREAAADIEQEVAVAALAALPSYDPARPFAAWVLGMAKHKVIDRWRARRAPTALPDEALIADLAELAAEEVEQAEAERAALRECLQTLPERSWSVVRAHYYDDQPTADIAERLGLSPVNVRVLLHRVRGALRACIARRLGTSDG